MELTAGGLPTENHAVFVFGNLLREYGHTCIPKHPNGCHDFARVRIAAWSLQLAHKYFET